MKIRLCSLAALAVASALFPAPGSAQHYNRKNLISNKTLPTNPDGSAVRVDPNLINPWGLTRSSTSPWWINNNGTGTSALFDGTGSPMNIFVDPPGSASDNFVMVPPPGFAPPGTISAPTGVVFNGSATDFLLNKGTPTGKNAVFIFVTEDGTISGWNPQVNIPKGGKAPSINAVLEVDNSDKGSGNGAVYKGATIADSGPDRFLYVTNFRSGKVEVYNTNFGRVNFPGAFIDESIPEGFAPFNIQNIGGNLLVTYAKQDSAHHDDVAGFGNGYVDIYSPKGILEGQLQHGSWMNSPWGVVWTTRDFGEFSNMILVGNFGSGFVAAFNGFTHQFIGLLLNPDNSRLTIDGLWSLTFANDATAGPATTLYFSAGPNHEHDGLFGTLTPVASEQDGGVE